MFQRSISSANARVRDFLGNASGVAAVEFAYLVPLLMLMTFGTFEMARAVIVHMRFQRAASMVGDLVAREQQLGSRATEAVSALNGIMLSGDQVLSPYSSTPFKVAITQLRASGTDATKTTVEWSYSYNGAAILACGVRKDMPATNMITTSNAAIIVEAQYQYTPLLTNVLPGLVKQMNWSDTMTFSPRYGSVFYGQATQNTTCPPGA